MGGSSLGNISVKDGRVEIGWTWLEPGSHGTRVNTTVKYLLLRFCFEELQAHRVGFKTDITNGRARAALKKIRATEEGMLRSHTGMHTGHYRDTAL